MWRLAACPKGKVDELTDRCLRTQRGTPRLRRRGHGSLLESRSQRVVPGRGSRSGQKQNVDPEASQHLTTQWHTDKMAGRVALCLAIGISIAACLSPVIIVPGDGSNQLEAKLDKPSVPHFYCSKTTAWYRLWLNLEILLPGVIDCWCDNIALDVNSTTGRAANRVTSNQTAVRPVIYLFVAARCQNESTSFREHRSSRGA